MSRMRIDREGWVRLIAVVAAVASLAVSTPIGATLYDGALIPLFAFAAMHAGSLVLALVRPRAAAALAVLACLAIPLVAQGGVGAPWPASVTTMITHALVVGLVAHRAGWLTGLLTMVAGIAAAGVAAILVGAAHDQQAVAVDLVVFASLTGATLAGGTVVREWQTVRSQLMRERQLSAEERARRVIAEEKTLIARELHDVIAHSMSIVNVQASSASARHPSLEAEIRGEFEDIAGASRRALDELRALLTVLRDERSGSALAPLPTLSRIPALVEQSAVPGTPVRLSWFGDRGDEGVSDLVGLAAYRIVQEALSNVIRHAPSAAATVRVDRGSHSISISVENTRPRGGDARIAAPARSSGQGVVGMRERAASVGGTIDLGPTADGGYLVRADLPLWPPGGAER